MAVTAETRPMDRPGGIPIAQLGDRTRFLTASGRPIIEAGQPELFTNSLRAKGVVFEYRPFGNTDTESLFDARSYVDKPMNHSAGAEIENGQQDMLDGLAWVHDKYFAGSDAAKVTKEDAFNLALITQALPVYLAFRAYGAVDGKALPNVVGNMHKAGSGVLTGAREMIMRPETLEPDSLEPDKFYNYVNNNALLIGAEEVCPVPPAVIKDSTAALVHGRSGNAAASELNALIPDAEVPALIEFSDVWGRYWDEVAYYKMSRSEFIKDWVIERAGAEDEPFFLALDQYFIGQEHRINNTVEPLQRRANVLLGREPLTLPTLTRSSFENSIDTSEVTEVLEMLEDTPTRDRYISVLRSNNIY